MILLEAGMLGLIGAGAGVTVGTAAVVLLNTVGMPFPPMGGSTQLTYIYPRISATYAMWVVGLAILWFFPGIVTIVPDLIPN